MVSKVAPLGLDFDATGTTGAAKGDLTNVPDASVTLALLAPEAFGLDDFSAPAGDFIGMPAKQDTESVSAPGGGTYLSPHYVFIRPQATTPLDRFDVSVVRDVSYTGGRGGGSEAGVVDINTAFRVISLVGQNANANEVAATFTQINRAPGAEGLAGPQNWAVNVFANKEPRVAPPGGWPTPADARTGHSGGICIQFNDNVIEASGADSTGASPLEVSYRGRSVFGLGKGCINMTAAPNVGTHTNMDQLLGASMIGDVQVDRIIAMFMSPSVETFPGVNTGAAGTYNFLFKEPDYALSKGGVLEVRRSVINRASGATAVNAAYKLQVDGADKATLYVDNSLGLQIEAETSKLRLNPLSAAFEPTTNGSVSLGEEALAWGPIWSNGPIRAGVRTTTTMPSAAAFFGAIVYVADIQTYARSDGTTWNRFTLGAAV